MGDERQDLEKEDSICCEVKKVPANPVHVPHAHMKIHVGPFSML
jgi:hypothetical protein